MPISKTITDRLSNLAAVASSKGVAAGVFFTPSEQTESLVVARGLAAQEGVNFGFYGGLPDEESLCERRGLPLFWAPFYADSLLEAAEGVLTAVRVRGSGYEVLTHSSYLGAVLALGIERDVLGDIVVCGERGELAYILAKPQIGAFIAEQLHAVGRDIVRCELVPLSEIPPQKQEFTALTDTIASPRLDCVVGALCNASRERASKLITSGAVSLNYTEANSKTREIRPGDIISIRGVGKFVIDAISDLTKKDRIRLSARKYA